MKPRYTLGLAAVLICGFSLSALAYSCPTNMRAIDAALATMPQVSASELAKAKALRAQGEALHKSGSHRASLDALHKAEAILGIAK